MSKKLGVIVASVLLASTAAFAATPKNSRVIKEPPAAAKCETMEVFATAQEKLMPTKSHAALTGEGLRLYTDSFNTVTNAKQPYPDARFDTIVVYNIDDRDAFWVFFKNDCWVSSTMIPIALHQAIMRGILEHPNGGI